MPEVSELRHAKLEQFPGMRVHTHRFELSEKSLIILVSLCVTLRFTLQRHTKSFPDKLNFNFLKEIYDLLINKPPVVLNCPPDSHLQRFRTSNNHFNVCGEW